MKKKILPIIFCSFILIFCLLTIILPKSARSANEKRVLATFPEFSWESFKTGSFMSDFDTYVADHFAFREKWVGLYSYISLYTGLGGGSDIYACDDNYLIAAPKTYNETLALGNLNKIEAFTKDKVIPTYLMIVPETGYILDDKLPSKHKEYYDDKLFEPAKNIDINLIDLRPSFKENRKNTDIYYRTDHHVTSEGALIMYNEFCKALEFTPKEFVLDRTVDGFYGTSYSKSGLWLKKPDCINIYKCKDRESDFSIEIDNKSYDSLFFEDKLKTEDKYEVFINGNHGLTVIKNNSIKETDEGYKRHLLIVKDSFSHCFTTFLAENYEEIVLIDLRYYKRGATKIINDYDITETLFLYGAENLATGTDFGWLNF